MRSQRRFTAVMATLVGLPLAVALVAIGAVVAGVVFGVSIDASRWRDTASRQASVALGQPVALQGALELTLGRELTLRIGSVQILNSAGFQAQEFLAFGKASARFDLFEALRGRPRLHSLEASDVGLWLERAADGRANWAPAPQPDPAAPQAAIDIGQITLHRLAIHYHDARSATRRFVALDELSGSARANDPLRLALRGRGGEQSAYTLTVDGGPARLIQSASEPWPFTLDFASSGTRLHAGGVLDVRKGEARFDFGASAEDLARVGQMVGAKLPHVGAAALHGTVAATADAVALTNLRGTLGESELSGQLALAFASARQRLSGSLSVTAFDLRPFLAAEPGSQRKRLDDDALAQQALALRDLVPIDLDIDLRVGRWLGLPVDIRDASFALHADAQGVRAPMRVTVAGAVFSGLLELDTAGPTPKLALQLAAKDIALAELARNLTDAQGIAGTLGRISVRVDSRGETLETLVRDLELSLAVAAMQVSYRSADGRRPIAFTLDTLDLAAGRGERLRGRARGSLLGERAKLSIRGGTVPDLLRERATPLELELAVAQAKLRVEATLADPRTARGTALRFDFQARRSGDLARWLGTAPESNLPVALRGRMRIADAAWNLDETTLKLGRSELTINAHRTRSASRPITTASVRSPLIDVPELSTLRASTSTSTGTRLDAPIFSAAVELADADIELELQHVLLGRTDLVGVGLVARTREGRLLPSSAKGKLAGAPFTALVELDPRGEVPVAKLDLSTGEIDVGVLLRGLGVADDIDGHVNALHLTLLGRGNTLRELAGQTALMAHVAGGSITVLGAAQRPVAEIHVNEASIGAAAGEPIRVRLDGTLAQTPVKIEVTSGTFADFAGDATRLPFALVANAAGARLALEGEVTLPLGSEGQLTFDLSGERLDTLNELARAELPAWGPWSLRGPIRMTPTGYEVQGLHLDVGQSRLSGSGKLDMSGPRPQLDVQVAAPSIQLDDFPMPQRLTDPPPGLEPGKADGLRGTASQLAGRTDRLLSAGFLRRLDATIDVQAHEVLAGTDRLADGELHFRLKDGRLHLDPAVVNLPGGTMRLSISYDVKGSEVEFSAAAHVDHFDYGIIARRLGRADDLRGLFSLDMALAGRAPSLDTIMRNANGRLDFAAWPTGLRSGIFKLWSVNLVLTLIPLINPGGESQVNCIVGRFDLKDGNLTGDKMMIDTSAVRVRGSGHANLATEELEFVFRPRAKGLALFRLQTPLRVTGTLDDQRFGFGRRDAVESVLRLIASPILLPIERLTLGPLPPDGADLCTDPLRANGR